MGRVAEVFEYQAQEDRLCPTEYGGLDEGEINLREVRIDTIWPSDHRWESQIWRSQERTVAISQS